MPGLCKARQYSDQMQCCRCGYIWDMNDDDPPTCKTKEQIGTEAINRIRELFSDGKNIHGK